MNRIPLENQVSYEVQRIKSGEISPDLFFAKAVGIQNSKKTYTLAYANDKFTVSCETLCTVGFCNKSSCEHCKLNAAHNQAVKDILSGERTGKIKNAKVVSMYDKEYYLVTIMDLATGIKNLTYYPIDGNRTADYWAFVSQEEFGDEFDDI